MKVTLNIPNKLSEISLSKYQRWIKVAKDSEDSFFLQQKMVEIFCDIPLKVVNVMKASDVTECYDIMNKLFNGKTPLKKITNIKGVDYGFIPNLDDMTFGEYVDLDTYISDWETMNKAMAVLYRPCTYKDKRTYRIEPYEGAEKLDMSEIDLEAVFGSLVFFYNLRNELQKTILNYLATQKDIELPQHLQDSLQSGVGINLSTDLLMETSLESIVSQKQMFTHV
jgi:hypothetical protein